MREAAKYRLWIAAVLVPAGALAVASWALMSSLDLRRRLLHEATRVADDYGGRACWVTEPPEVLVLGSSMARYGVAPEEIAKANGIPLAAVANVSWDAVTPFVEYFTYLSRREVLGRARVVYVTLDPWMYTAKYHKHSPTQRLLWSYPQWIFMSGELRLQGSYFLPAVEAYRRLRDGPGEGRRACDRSAAARRGFVPRGKGRKVGRVPRADEAYAIFEDLDLFGPCAVQIDYLGRIREMVEAAGGAFVLLLTPKHPFWNEVYRAEAGYDARMRRLIDARLGPVRVAGSFDRSRYGLGDADFFDLSHLTERGARRFTAAEFADVGRHARLEPAPLRPLLEY